MYATAARLRTITVLCALLAPLTVAPISGVASAAPAAAAVNAVTGGAVEPVDPLRKADADGMLLNRIAPAWSWTTGSPDVVVAVLDTGVSPIEDLDDGRLLPGHDVVNGDDDAVDDQGHGTYTAATIAGEADNDFGGAGVCWTCRILPVKVMTTSASGGTTGKSADVAAGIIWAADHGADIIDVEFVGTGDTPQLRDAVAHATAAGALIVAPAGNRKSAVPTFPASIEPVLAVGGTDATGKPLADASINPATDPWIDITAAGIRYGTDHLGKRVRYSSSLPATSLVSGTAALLLSLRPDATATQVRAALLEGSVAAADGWGGARQLDAGKAAKTFGPVDTVAPIVTSTGVRIDGVPLCECLQSVTPVVVEDRDIVRLELLVNGDVAAVADGSPMRLSWRPSGVEGPVDVTVRAYDSSGNVGAAGVTVEIDATKPTVRLVSPENYGAVDGVTTIAVDGPPDLATVWILGKKIDTTVGKGPWTTTIDFSEEKPGWFSLLTEMRDVAGNRGIAQNWVYVDHDTPVIKLDEKDFPTILRGPIQFHVLADDTDLVNFDLIIGGAVVSSTGIHSTMLPWPGAEKLTGTYDLTFRVTDGVGHSSEVTRTVRVDNTVPKIAAVAPANKTVVRRTFTATASGVTDASGITKVELWVDAERVVTDKTVPYTFPVKTGTRNGPMQLEWIAYDAAGNTTTVYRWVTADNKGPTVSISKGPKHKAKVKGKVAVGVTAKDANGVARVELLVNGKVVATDKTAAYAFTVDTAKHGKTMKIKVLAYDRAGNVTATSSRTWYRR
jgi:hypothetical protein